MNNNKKQVSLIIIHITCLPFERHILFLKWNFRKMVQLPDRNTTDTMHDFGFHLNFCNREAGRKLASEAAR